MLRVLLVADTHLGFDLPDRPRGDRTRRGEDFFACFRQALEPARRGEVDVVVHGGDLLYRSRVSARLVSRALEPLLEVADLGVPVLLVPGNHERSSLPYPLLAAHAHLHVFDRPRTISLEANGMRAAFSGFPCERDEVAARLPSLLAATRADDEAADVRLLCLHQTVEGARVGPAGFTFRSGADVIPGSQLPSGYAAVLAGHIHRHQVLTRDLAGRTLPTPVIYPGSVERTSFAEREEVKGYVTLDLAADAGHGGRLAAWRFHELPARPMRGYTIDARGLEREALSRYIAAILRDEPDNAVVKLRVLGPLAAGAGEALRVASLRRLHPSEMIVSVRVESV